jgi:hypothetical protein
MMDTRSSFESGRPADEPEIEVTERAEGETGFPSVVTISHIPYLLASALSRRLHGTTPDDISQIRDISGVGSVEWTGLDRIRISLTDAEATEQVVAWFTAFRKRVEGSK